ncbi:kinase-like domain-containing protein, partial [Collybia nuda]
DLSDCVRKNGEHYEAIGDHADMWSGELTISGRKYQVAIKVLRGGPMRKTNSQTKLDKARQLDLERYGQIWRNLDDPHIARFWGLAFNFGPMPALILDYYPHGNIVGYIKKQKVPNEGRMRLLHEIAQGIQFLHSCQPSIVHGDIRGANVLINGNGQAVLADYQLAFIIESSDFTSVKTAGTCRWTAPEIMSPPEDDSPTDSPSLFTLSSDIFSFAMTFIEVFTEQVPFATKKNDSSVIFAILDGHRPDLPSYVQSNEALTVLLKNCWAEIPSERPTAEEVCNDLAHVHPFFAPLRPCLMSILAHSTTVQILA